MADQPGITFADLQAMYDRMANMPPVEPIKLTREQRDWVREHQAVGRRAALDLIGFPIEIVETIEESTPHLNNWTDWPGALTGLGHVPRPWIERGWTDADGRRWITTGPDWWDVRDDGPAWIIPASRWQRLRQRIRRSR